MRILFPFIFAKDLCMSLLIVRTSSSFTLLYIRGAYARLVYTWYKNIVRMIAVLIVFIELKERKEYDGKNIKTRQRQYRDKTVLLLATQ